ncbi:MAG: hypothetical protein U0324_23370 [Polyangiales bacterium]
MAKPASKRPRRRRSRTEWHPPFYALVEWRCPRWIRPTPEVMLQRQSQRIDLLLSLRARVPRDPDDRGRVLRSLWKHVPRVALLELKSLARAFAAGDLYRLVACGWHWLARNRGYVPGDVLLVLVLPCITEALRAELAACPLTLAPQEEGYHLGEVGPMRVVVVELDVVSEAERDDYLRVFSRHPIQTEEVVEWLRHQTDIPEDVVLPPEEVAKNEPLLKKIAQSLPLRVRLEGLKPEERLSGLKPEERLSGLKPEERLAGLPPEHTVLALPDAMLARLPESFLATLPADVQSAIRARLAR